MSAVTAGMHTGSAAARRDLSHSVRWCGPCTSERTDAGGSPTTPSGCRVGVAGRYVDRNGQMILQQVQSLNLRIARAVPLMLPDRLCEILQRHFIGMLIVGEPDSGKTTFLRQIAQSLAGMQRRVCVVDERGEIYPQELSGPDRQLPAVDTLSGIPKERAVQMALRTLSPQVIVLDELGSLAETAALEQGFFSGVDFIASVHAASAEEAVRRPQVKALQQQGMLRVLVLLQGLRRAGQGSGRSTSYDPTVSLDGSSAASAVRMADRSSPSGRKKSSISCSCGILWNCCGASGRKWHTAGRIWSCSAAV